MKRLRHEVEGNRHHRFVYNVLFYCRREYRLKLIYILGIDLAVYIVAKKEFKSKNFEHTYMIKLPTRLRLVVFRKSA